MCPSLIEIGSKTAKKNSAQTNRQTNRHYENNGRLAVNQRCGKNVKTSYRISSVDVALVINKKFDAVYVASGRRGQ